MRGPKTRQIEAINADCDRALDAGVVLDGAPFHSDNTFLLELLALVMGYQLGLRSGTQPIRTRDNQIIEMDLDQLTTLAAAVGTYRQATYAACWAQKDALP
jgi:hypothetical protein